MRKTILIASLFTIIVYLFPQNAFGGAWTVPKHRVWGEYFFKWQWAKEKFGDDYKKKKKGNDARSWEFVMEPKIEVGITDWLNLLWSLEYKESKYKEYGRPADWGPFRRKNHGINHVKVGAKLRFMEEPFVLSGQIKGFIYPGYGNYHGDDPAYRNQPSIGDGDDAIELRGLIGKKFDLPYSLYNNKPIQAYIGAEAGYRWRSAAVANDIPLFIETGIWPFKWLLVKTELDTLIAHSGTGDDKDYMIWRIGPCLQLLGDSTLREGNKILNVEFQYGMTVFGKNMDAFQELVLKVQVQF